MKVQRSIYKCWHCNKITFYAMNTMEMHQCFCNLNPNLPKHEGIYEKYKTYHIKLKWTK